MLLSDTHIEGDIRGEIRKDISTKRRISNAQWRASAPHVQVAFGVAREQLVVFLAVVQSSHVHQRVTLLILGWVALQSTESGKGKHEHTHDTKWIQTSAYWGRLDLCQALAREDARKVNGPNRI